MMEGESPKREDIDGRIDELNRIFGELLADAKDFAGDMISGINRTFVAGALAVLFGVQTSYYNRQYILRGDIIPLLIAGAQIVSGLIIVLQGFTLRKKYARLFELKKRLDGS